MTIRRLRENKYLAVSITALVLSYFPYLLPESARGNSELVLGGSFLYLAVISIGEHLSRKLANFSLIRTILSSRRSLFIYLIVGMLGGILLDGTAQWLSKLWYYPLWSEKFYVLILYWGFQCCRGKIRSSF